LAFVEAGTWETWVQIETFKRYFLELAWLKVQGLFLDDDPDVNVLDVLG
jgi:hypothetical protein